MVGVFCDDDEIDENENGKDDDVNDYVFLYNKVVEGFNYVIGCVSVFVVFGKDKLSWSDV